MAVEEIKNFDSNEGIKKEITSINKVDYNNPSKKIMEENNPLVKKEQEEADDILPENIEKRRKILDKKVNIMEEGATKDSYTKLLSTIQTAIQAEDWTTANDRLTKVETKLNTSEKKTEKEISIEENTKTKKIQTEINTENISDITKDMQKLGETEKIDINKKIFNGKSRDLQTSRDNSLFQAKKWLQEINKSLEDYNLDEKTIKLDDGRYQTEITLTLKESKI